MPRQPKARLVKIEEVQVLLPGEDGWTRLSWEEAKELYHDLQRVIIGDRP